MDAENVTEILDNIVAPAATTSDSNPNRQNERSDVSNWDPLAIDVANLDRTVNSFIVVGSNDLKNNSAKAIELLESYLPKLLKKRFILRTMGDDRNVLDSAIYPAYTFKEFYVPWKKFNELITPTLAKPSDAAYRMALWTEMQTKKEFSADRFNSERWRLPRLFNAAKTHLLLGKDLDKPLKAIIVWTSCGSTRFTKDTDFDNGGNVLNFFKVAELLGIKIYNLNNEDSVKELDLLFED